MADNYKVVSKHDGDKDKIPESINQEELKDTDKLSKDFSEKLGRKVYVSIQDNTVNVMEFMRD